MPSRPLSLPVVSHSGQEGVGPPVTDAPLSPGAALVAKLKQPKVLGAIVGAVVVVAVATGVAVGTDANNDPQVTTELQGGNLDGLMNDDYSVYDTPTTSPTVYVNPPTGSSNTPFPTTSAPTMYPTTSTPTTSPTTSTPTTSPTTSAPTSPMPTQSPTQSPTKAPTQSPTQSPTKAPTQSPTHSPSQSPTQSPTKSPTNMPTTSTPDYEPTVSPTTSSPTVSPTRSPTSSPTGYPTTSAPTTSSPTGSVPTNLPTTSPTDWPTYSSDNPTAWPTSSPTDWPTTTEPTLPPSPLTPAPTPSTPQLEPTTSPTASPTASPTDAPTKTPTKSPTTSAPTTSAPTTSAPTTSTPTTSAPTTERPTRPPVSWPTRGPVPTVPPTTFEPTVSPTLAPTGDNSNPPTLPPTDGDCPYLGKAAPFNGFFCGHYVNPNESGNINGRLAVRGNLDVRVVSICSDVQGIEQGECVPGDYGVVVGGDGNFESGNQMSLAHAIEGTKTGAGWDVPTCPGDLEGSLPADFEFGEICASLENESDRLADDEYQPSSHIRANTTYVNWRTNWSSYNGKWMQVPIDASKEINIINVVHDLTIGDSIVNTVRFIEVQPGDKLKAVILNYMGESAEMPKGYKWDDVTLDTTTVSKNTKILWNMPRATLIKPQSGMPGSILAPRADVHSQASGVLRGQLIARSYTAESSGRNGVTLKDQPFTCATTSETPTLAPTTRYPTRSPTAGVTQANTETPTGPICPELGNLYKYNALVCGDFKASGSDIQGRLAVKGDFMATLYSVGHELPGHDTCVDGDYSIVVGGHANWVSGKKYSRAYAVGNGMDYRADNPFLQPNCPGDTETDIAAQTGLVFDSACNLLEQESARLASSAWKASLAGNDRGVVFGEATYYGGETDESLGEGDHWEKNIVEIPIDFSAKVNVIQMNVDLRIGNNVNTIKFVEKVPGDQLVSVILNVPHYDVQIGAYMKWIDGSITNTSEHADKLSKILWNMYGTEKLSVTGSFAGSILAPKAEVLDSSSGTIRGNVFVKSYVSESGTFAQINLPAFSCPL